MIINSITGKVTRALPTADGMEVKISTGDASVSLFVPSSRVDLIETLRAARMNDNDITVRFSAEDVVIGTETPRLARAA